MQLSFYQKTEKFCRINNEENSLLLIYVFQDLGSKKNPFFQDLGSKKSVFPRFRIKKIHFSKI